MLKTQKSAEGESERESARQTQRNSLAPAGERDIEKDREVARNAPGAGNASPQRGQAVRKGLDVRWVR